MNMKLGTTALHVTYSDVELRERVLDYVDRSNDGIGFKDICTYILTDARQEGKLDAPQGEVYEWEALDRKDVLRIDRILWQAILDRELMIDFDSTHYSAVDTYFVRMPAGE